ncbi:MAG: hypothetical protein H6837_14240 [Planctomycetes bacterium]|nr:hypothetical protein [Planctomycetota bacterium]
MKIPYPRSALTLALAALAGTPLVAQLSRQPVATSVPATIDRVSDQELTQALEKFAKLSAGRQAEVLQAVERAVGAIDHPLLRGVASFAKLGTNTGRTRYKKVSTPRSHANSETAAKTSSALVDRVPFPTTCEYQWAFGHIEKRDPTPPGTRLSASKRRTAARMARLDGMCHGFPADLDRALAAMLRQLDDDRSADPHAVLLESWHNGVESFYEALDRTAGTPEKLFYFDAMLADWAKRCIDKRHPERRALIASSKATQQAFYQMARTYRSYRSLREMIALTLVLPPDQDLPEPLRGRYQDNAGEAYSTRTNVTLLLAAHGGDIEAVLRALGGKLGKMPADTWHKGDDPVQGLYEVVGNATVGKDTDALLARHKTDRLSLHERVAQAARQALIAALPKR